MRYAEYALLLVPLGVIIAWYYGIRGLSFRGLAVVLAVYAVLGGTLYWFGAHRVSRGVYVPAHLENGRVMPGHWK